MIARLHFEEEKKQVTEQVLSMGTRVEEDLRKAISAFKDKNTALAEEVKADDEVINAYQASIEDACARMIATQQPVAQDMRWLIATIKIVDELERVGDHAVHLAKAAIKLEKESHIKPMDTLEKMAEVGCDMIHLAVQAYINLDTEKARTSAAMDDRIDGYHKELVSALLDYTQKHPDKVAQGTKIIQTSGFMERLGDHVTNICELIVYCVEGVHVELNE